MKILTLSNLYPHKEKPTFGIFVENRLQALLATGGIETLVISPKPWFPLLKFISAEYAAAARLPAMELRQGVTVYYPRYLHIPRLGMRLQPFLMALRLRYLLRHLRARGFDFDLIDAHYFYPDGVAAVLLGNWFQRPVMITARGSDINEIATHAKPRAMILDAACQAAHVATVSEALRQKLIALGVPGENISTLRNGVDLVKFHPSKDRAALRKARGVTRLRVISVGNLIPLKGHDLVIRAMGAIPAAELVICGDGPELANLQSLVSSLNLGDRVSFTGRLNQGDLIEQYQLADVLILASATEGWPNVLLEAMACGTAVVATDVGGVREILEGTDAGVMCERTLESISLRLSQLLQALPDRESARKHAEKFDWQATSQNQKRLMAQAIGARR